MVAARQTLQKQVNDKADIRVAPMPQRSRRVYLQPISQSLRKDRGVGHTCRLTTYITGYRRTQGFCFINEQALLDEHIDFNVRRRSEVPPRCAA